MSLDLDLPPLYDPLTKKILDKAYLSDNWRDWMAAFVQTLSTYLTSGGMFLPLLTTAQRNALQNPLNGQMIYNTDLGSAQYFKAGAWVSF